MTKSCVTFVSLFSKRLASSDQLAHAFCLFSRYSQSGEHDQILAVVILMLTGVIDGAHRALNANERQLEMGLESTQQ